MNCPTADKLSQFVDHLVTEQEHSQIKNHVNTCEDCKRVVAAFEEEQEFIKETLKTPTLPDDFALNILEKLEPYEEKGSKKKKVWRRRLVLAAGIVLAIGLSTALNPSLAKWIGGLFSTDQVDEGLRMASDAGFAERVNRESTNNGITFKVEDVVADPSRVALSYQVLNEKGKTLNSYLEPREQGNDIYVTDQNGKRLDMLTLGWTKTDDYGFIEFSLREFGGVLENIVVHFDLVELNGKKGNWKLEIPVDLKESLQSTNHLSFNNAKTSWDGVALRMKEVRFAPSSNEIMYETSFTDEEQKKVMEQVERIEKKFGKKNVGTFSNYETAIEYHIENDKGQAISYHNTYFEGKGHPSDSGLLQGSGQPLEKMGSVAWNESFIPQKDSSKLTFVLDGVFKTVPGDFSIKIKPNDLKNQPVSFEYEGNYITIQSAKIKNEYSLRKSINPVEKETTFRIQMEGGKEALASALGNWLLVDDKGNSYLTNKSDAILDEKDKHGRYKTSIELTVDGLEETPEEFTLQLLSVTRYSPVKAEWKVPLYK